MAKRNSRTGQILAITVALVSGSALIFTAASLVPRSAPTTRNVTSREVRTLLVRAGFDAESLAIAGLDVPAAAQLVSNARTHLENSTLSMQEHDFAVAAAAVGRAGQTVQSGKASSEDLTQLAGARIALTNQEGTLATARAAFLTAATAGLDQTTKAKLALLRSNAKWPVPIEYKLIERTEADWVGIRDGLIANRDLLDGSGVNIADAESVAAAATLLASTREAVAGAWNAASE